MDDILIDSTKKAHKDRFEEILKVLLKDALKISPKN